jgi:hypothetical protein
VHDFRVTEEVDLRPVLGQDIGRVRALQGTLYQTYEWVTPLATEFGTDGVTDFRDEAKPDSAHGKIFVIIHSEVASTPTSTPEIREFLDRLQGRGIQHLLVFFNDTDVSGTFGSWFSNFQPLLRTPQGLGSLAFNVLTTTLSTSSSLTVCTEGT